MKRLRDGLVRVVGIAAVIVGTACAAHAIGRIVYTGQDPSCHFTSHSEATTLAANAVHWVSNGATNPPICVVQGNDCDPTPLLTAAGFTNLTTIADANLASTDLSGCTVLWIGRAFSEGSFTAAASANVQNFVNGGGGLVSEDQHGTPGFSWLPFGTQIGPIDVGEESVTIVAPAHPVMAGLTNAGLSNWGTSIHQEFTSPGVAGFTTLDAGPDGTAAIIARDAIANTAAPAVGEAGLGILALMLLGSGVRFLRRSGTV